MTIIDDIYDKSPNFVITILTFTIFGDIMKLVIVTKGVCLLDSITALIKNEIKSQYKSLSKFAEASGIPYSTLSNALSRGVGGTSYDTVIKICKMLNIKQAYDSDIVLFNNEFHDIYSKLTQLDEQGVHTVCTVLNVEYSRCVDKESDSSVKAFNGIGYASTFEEPFDPERIKTLVKKVQEDG